jgi:hypothetical protein
MHSIAILAIGHVLHHYILIVLLHSFVLFCCNPVNAYDVCRYVQNNMLSGTVPPNLLSKDLVLK